MRRLARARNRANTRAAKVNADGEVVVNGCLVIFQYLRRPSGSIVRANEHQLYKSRVIAQAFNFSDGEIGVFIRDSQGCAQPLIFSSHSAICHHLPPVQSPLRIPGFAVPQQAIAGSYAVVHFPGIQQLFLHKAQM